MSGTIETRFWGVRGSVPVSNRDVVHYGGNTSCVELKADNGTHLVFDGGSGIFPLGNKYIKEGLPDNFAIFITHSHWDHIQGLPFFAPAYVPGNKFILYGCDQGTLAFRDVLARQMQSPYFPVKFSKWMADVTIGSIGETEININGLKIRSSYAEHPGMTLGYRLEYKDKSIVYLPDNEPFARFSMDKVFFEDQEGPDDLDMENVFLEDQKKKFFGFIGSADILIHDAQYTPEEYSTKVGWGHSSFELALKAALYGSVKHLVLFHHDPLRSDTEIETLIKVARQTVTDKGGSLKISAASENMPVII
jgi:phosphoribosyl 1,2-cyclic phosphodiesterase